MATRSTIVLKLKDSDLGKKIKVDPHYLSHDPDIRKKYDDKCFEIELEKPYMQIYCHWDGYPSGVGQSLMNMWNDYSKILNLLLGGDASYIEDSHVTQYIVMNDRDEKYEDLKPRFFDECPNRTEDYQYLFKDNKWYVRGYGEANFSLLSDKLD